jgi:hypothetical protein
MHNASKLRALLKRPGIIKGRLLRSSASADHRRADAYFPTEGRLLRSSASADHRRADAYFPTEGRLLRSSASADHRRVDAYFHTGEVAHA